MRRPITDRLPIRQTGVVAIELAIVLPVLLLLMLVIAEIGRMLFHYNTLTKATRDGARYAAAHAALGSSGVVIVDDLPGSDWSDMKTDSTNLVVCGVIRCGGLDPLLPGLSSSNVTVVRRDDFHVEMSVSYDYQPYLGAPLSMLGFGDPVDLGITMNATLSMRAL